MPSAAKRKSQRQQGLTLVEVAVIICIVGVVLAVFVPTFIKEMRTSKTSEAAHELGRMHQLTAIYYRRSFRDDEGNRLTRCLPAGAGPTPPQASAAPLQIDFSATDTPGSATWNAIEYQPERSIRFRYSLTPIIAGCDVDGDESTPAVTFQAEGDLDGDGKHSVFERSAAPDENGDLVPVGILQVLDRTE